MITVHIINHIKWGLWQFMAGNLYQPMYTNVFYVAVQCFVVWIMERSKRNCIDYVMFRIDIGDILLEGCVWKCFKFSKVKATEQCSKLQLVDASRGLYQAIKWGIWQSTRGIPIHYCNQYNGRTQGFEHCLSYVTICWWFRMWSSAQDIQMDWWSLTTGSDWQIHGSSWDPWVVEHFSIEERFHFPIFQWFFMPDLKW